MPNWGRESKGSEMKKSLSIRQKLWLSILLICVGIIFRSTLGMWASSATPEKAIGYKEMQLGSLGMIVGGLMALLGMALTASGKKLQAMGDKLEAEKKKNQRDK
jgi:hypothetical protein